MFHLSGSLLGRFDFEWKSEVAARKYAREMERKGAKDLVLYKGPSNKAENRYNPKEYQVVERFGDARAWFEFCR